MSDRLNIAFQGTKSGLVIAIDETLSFPNMIEALEKKLEDSGYFFVDAKVTLNLEGRETDQNELTRIQNLVQEKHGLEVIGIKSSTKGTLSAARSLGLEATVQNKKADFESVPESRPDTPARQPKSQYLPTDLLRRTVRSGQIYESPGNLVILGDVNPGAEVVAAGDIVVFGALRGLAYAGAAGKKDVIIVSLKLCPTQLRIAGRVARANGEESASNGPEYAFIENDQIVIDKWSNVNHLQTFMQ